MLRSAFRHHVRSVFECVRTAAHAVQNKDRLLSAVAEVLRWMSASQVCELYVF
jgi:hypothetical protein